MSNVKRLLSIFLVLLLIAAVYYPGLTGGFMLDDWGSLPKLFETIETYGFWYGVFDGGTGPTGRPFSLLSFALQQPAWQKSVLPFKAANLAIHILNAILVGILCRKLSDNLPLSSNQHRFYFALGVTLLWACAPIQISTVLYVVQRMVLLSAFFTLLGILGYIKGRDILITKNKTAGYIWMFASLGCFGGLAVISKENGLLLVLFILALELTLLKGQPENRALFKGWKILFLIGPFLAFLGYLLIDFQGRLLSIYEWRPFSLKERLLTQPRILWDYLHHILLPQGSDLGLFNDDYEISTTLLNPLTTVFSLIGILSAILFLFVYRKRWPLISFVIAWFLFGHAMESTIIPLELYFEHRNYLPSLSIVFGACYFLFWLYSKIKDKYFKVACLALFSLYFSLVLGITYNQSSMWGNQLEFAVVQSHEHPQSIRARSLSIGTLSRLGETDRAFEEAKKIQMDFPEIAATALTDMDFACYDQKYPVLPIEQVKERLKYSDFGYSVLKYLDETVELKAENKCPAVSTEYIKEAILALMGNPKFSHRINHLSILLASIKLQEGDLSAAISILKPLQGKTHNQKLFLARLLATKGHYQEALTEIDGAKKLISFSPKSRTQFIEINDLEKVVIADLKALETAKNNQNGKKGL